MKKLGTIALILSVCALFGCSDELGQDKINSETANAAANSGTPNSGTPNSGTPNSGTPNSGGPNSGTPGLSNDNVRIPLPADTNKLDVLFVIDNSGTMCRKQTRLRKDIDLFFNALADREIDFQVAVSTPQMDVTGSSTVVPGHLQSVPQPMPGFGRTCRKGIDQNGDPIENDFSPIVAAINDAVKCMESPDPEAYRFDTEEIRCAAEGGINCSIEGVCGGELPRCSIESIFPPPESYRALPKVLSSADYKVDGELDLGSFLADFSCISMVGTRGFGVEQGLRAAALTVSPELTGGATGSRDADLTAPNHGFLRPEAGFGLFFVTDENDCSNEDMVIAGACGSLPCDFANKEGEEGLIPLDELKGDLLQSLSSSKSRQLGEREVFIASIHGTSRRYDGPVYTGDECEAPGFVDPVEPVCTNALGRSYSGDRYDRYMNLFPPSQVFPRPVEGVRPGLMCNDGFGPVMEQAGESMLAATGLCISGFESGEVEVRAVAKTSDDAERLRSSGYCVTSFTDTARASCVIDSTLYTVEEVCPEGYDGVSITWNDPEEAMTALEGTELYLSEL